MNLSLYNMTTAMLALLESDDPSAEEIDEAFGAITEKDSKICHLRADILGDIAKFKAEEERLAARRKTMENTVNRLEEYIKASMLRLDVKEIQAGTFSIKLSPTAGSVEVLDEDAIPQEYKQVVQSVSIRKDAIKKALASGLSVDGAIIRPGWSIRIR